MSEETAVKEKVPVVGIGSAAGKRYFVCRFPEAKFTVTPARDVKVGDAVVKEKGSYVVFAKQVKPDRFQGDGMLGTNNRSGTDKNDPLYWGVFVSEYPDKATIDDFEAKRKRGEVLSRKERAAFEAKECVDFLREHEYYKKTDQNNECESKPWLKELTWDPRRLEPGSGARLRTRASESVPEPTVAAPEDGKPASTKARVADMGGKAK